METMVRRTYSLTLSLPERCGYCKEPCGHVYRDEDTPEGACLSCKIDAEAVAEYEAQEADAFWGAAEMDWQAAINAPVTTVTAGGDSERFPSEVDAHVWADMMSRRGLAVRVD